MKLKLYYVAEMRKHWDSQEEIPVYIAGPFGEYLRAVDELRHNHNYTVVETVVEVE